MSERTIEWIIANAINEQARGDPDALAPNIMAALGKAGYRITPGTEDTALGSQPFDELTPDMRPQDIHGDRSQTCRATDDDTVIRRPKNNDPKLIEPIAVNETHRSLAVRYLGARRQRAVGN